MSVNFLQYFHLVFVFCISLRTNEAIVVVVVCCCMLLLYSLLQFNKNNWFSFSTYMLCYIYVCIYSIHISFAAILQLILSTVLLSLAVVLSQCCLIFTSNISIYLLYIYVYKYTYIYIESESMY